MGVSISASASEEDGSFVEILVEEEEEEEEENSGCRVPVWSLGLLSCCWSQNINKQLDIVDRVKN